MIVLTLRTDKPRSEIGLYEHHTQLAYEVWDAHRQLAETLHTKVETMLQDTGKARTDLDGIVVYKGPGSFTGLRIGISVANALAYSHHIPIVSEDGDWIAHGIERLIQGDNDSVALPEYGQNAVTTAPKK